MPRTQKLSPLCTTSLSAVAPGLPVPRGDSGGGAALSPGFSLYLCSPEQIGAHFAAEPPERSFFFPLFLSAEKEKEVIGNAVTKSLSPKQNPTDSILPNKKPNTQSPEKHKLLPQGEFQSMLYTLFEIIISALSVYGGYRLIRDISRWLDIRKTKKQKQKATVNEQSTYSPRRQR